MRKKLLTVLATSALACTLGAGATVFASAGTLESQPAGEGLITSQNALNSESFRIVETADGDANAYQMLDSSSVNQAIKYTAGEWQEALVGSPVPKATMAKGATVTLTYNFLEFPEAVTSPQLLLNPAATSNTERDTYGYVLTGNNNGMAVVGGHRTGATSSDPASKLIAHHGGDAEHDASAGIAWQAYSWSATGLSGLCKTYGHVLFKMEMTVNADNWVDVKMQRGYSSDSGDVWVNGSTITNWAPYNSENDFYANVWFRYMDGVLVNSVKMTATYDESGETKTDVIFENDMNDATKVVTTTGATIDEGCFGARGQEKVPTEAAGFRVTDPALGTGVSTRAALATDATLPLNFELNTQVQLRALAAGQKVGLMFGLEDNRSISGAHKYVYLTYSEDNKVMLGVESVDADGVATALIDEVEVAGATVGAEAAYIPLSLTGKLANVEIGVGTNEAITVENMNLDGFFALTHKGEGELCYQLSNLTMKGYSFSENEKSEAVTTNFNGEYLNSNKFQSNSTTTSIDSFMVATDKTAHALNGMVTENGVLGFYGTTTGTRILFNDQYADFVLQFDYISMPVLERGQLTGVSRRSPLFVMFGMKEGGVAVNDAGIYTLALHEGLSDPGMFGTNGTVLQAYGKVPSAQTKGLATIVETTTPDDNSIPKYASGGYTTAEGNNVETWYNVDESVSTYSMYNKTTRVKLVAANNYVAMYLAEVNTETGAVDGEYVQVAAFKAEDTAGYLGLATDAPAYFEIDNLALTPVSREDALAVTEASQLSATFVADIAPADMDVDNAPTPLAAPVLTMDTANKKVSWAAIDNAKEYIVTVKLGTETIIETTVTTTELDLSSLNVAGTYKVTVEAIPADEDAYLSNRATEGYEVTDAMLGGGNDGGDNGNNGNNGDGNNGGDDGSATNGCGGCGGTVAGATFAVLAAAGAALVAIKRRKDQ